MGALNSRKLGETILEELWFGEDDLQASNQEASTHFAAFLGEVEGLRPFPVVVQKVLAKLAQPDFEHRAVLRMIEEDPSLCAKLLRTANSPLFRGRDACVSVGEAMIRMGARTVTELVASVGAMSVLNDATGAGKLVRDHSAGTAAIVRTLAARRVVPSGTAFLCGLLHDMGKLLLLQSDEEEYQSLGNAIAAEPDRIHLDERRMLGFDHAVLGGHVLVGWQIPDPVPQVVAWHHQPGRAYAHAGQVGSLVALLRLADQLEALIRVPGEPDPAVLKKLASGPDASFASFSAEELAKLWPELNEARSEALQLFR